MKTKLISLSFLSALLILLSGCSQDETVTEKPATRQLQVVAEQKGFVSTDNPSTRISYSGATTTFTSGDAIGVYALDDAGNAVSSISNLKLTYNGTNWVDDSGNTYLTFVVGGRYFAYYPYSSMAPTVTTGSTITTPEAFFATYISQWSPTTTQGDLTTFAGYDLMVATASESGGEITATQFKFTFAHTMAMIELQLPQVKTTNSYNSKVFYKYTFTSHTLYNIANGTYRILVRPSANTTISGDLYDGIYRSGNFSITDAGIDAGNYKIYKDNGQAAGLTTNTVNVTQ